MLKKKITHTELTLMTRRIKVWEEGGAAKVGLEGQHSGSQAPPEVCSGSPIFLSDKQVSFAAKSEFCLKCLAFC